jgi:hypothetical protein
MNLGIVLLLILAGLIAWLATRWYRRRPSPLDPMAALLNQAAQYKWSHSATVRESGEGRPWTTRSTRFTRRDEEAVIWYEDATITLVRNHAPPTFDDFAELEAWLRKNPRDSADDTTEPKILYMREIERFVIRHGHFMSLLEETSSDYALFLAVATFQKAGYRTGEPAVIVAALTLDALLRYKKDPKGAVGFLTRMQADFEGRPPVTAK